MSRTIIINGHAVKTESADPPLPHFTGKRWYAWLEGDEEVVGNGTSRHLAIESLREQLKELTS